VTICFYAYFQTVSRNFHKFQSEASRARFADEVSFCPGPNPFKSTAGVTPYRKAMRRRVIWPGMSTKTRMSSATEMNLFFTRNCYSETERAAVKASPAYRGAIEKADVIEAQEIATRVHEASHRAAVATG
jgi:hypothetical protein